MRTPPSRPVVLLVGLALVIAACGGRDADPPSGSPTPPAQPAPGDPWDALAEDDLLGRALLGAYAGRSVRIVGTERSSADVDALAATLAVFRDVTGIDAEYVASVELAMGVLPDPAAGGAQGADDAADVLLLPRARTVRELADRGLLVAVPAAALAHVAAQHPDGTNDAHRVGGATYALRYRSELRSVLWVNEALLARFGGAVPGTWDELRALSERMVADGVTPWCVGVEAPLSIGWPFSDWVEEVVLRRHGGDVYDAWARGDIPFSDPRIVAAGEEVLALWDTPGMLHAAGGTLTTTSFERTAAALAAGDCALHLQGRFLAVLLAAAGATVGPGGDVSPHPLPAADDGSRPLVSLGSSLAALRDAPEVWALLTWLTEAEGQEVRMRAQAEQLGEVGGDGVSSGFLSSNRLAERADRTALDEVWSAILLGATSVHDDASDLMDGARSRAFWEQGAAAVEGSVALADAFAAVDAAG